MPPAAPPGESSTSRRCRADRRVRLPDGRSHGLTKDTEYFVALSGCSSTQCRTAGFAKFTAWQQGGGKQNLVVIIAGSGAAVAVAACVIAVGVTLGIRFGEYIYDDVLMKGQSGQTSQQPAEMQNFDGGAQLRLRRFQGLRGGWQAAKVQQPTLLPCTWALRAPATQAAHLNTSDAEWNGK
uniref:Fibronectin type-III domain-containing protein n=1 Tax=Macrostomum lignano TaxID=282301 RepID=A0A1I8FDP5_9PLAT